MLVNTKEMLKYAKQHQFAVPAVNIYDLHSLRGVLKSSIKHNYPIIISLAEVHLPLLSIKEAVNLVHYYAKQSNNMIALHFDHGFSKEYVIEAIESGFTSVMIDASSKPFDENVKLTKEILEIAKKHNVSVEAEIGHVGGGEGYVDADKDLGHLTQLDEAVEFIKQTNVDSLAISIGTAHGAYKGTPKIHFERLEEIANAIETPLVLHGGSGSGDDNITKCVKLGITKVNLFTDMVTAAKNEIIPIFEEQPFDAVCLRSEDGFEKCLDHYYEVLCTKEIAE